MTKDLPVFHYPERDAIRKAVGDCSRLTALDAGSRWPQMTDVLKPAVELVAWDFNAGALLPSAHFDIAVSSLVLPRLETAGLRRSYVDELSRTLKTNGRLIITAQNYNLRFPKFGIPQEEVSTDGCYHRYRVDEFRSELERRFRIQTIWGLWTYLPNTYRIFTALGKYNVYWDRMLRERPISLKYGKFLLAICTPQTNSQ